VLQGKEAGTSTGQVSWHRTKRGRRRDQSCSHGAWRGQLQTMRTCMSYLQSGAGNVYLGLQELDVRAGLLTRHPASDILRGPGCTGWAEIARTPEIRSRIEPKVASRKKIKRVATGCGKHRESTVVLKTTVLYCYLRWFLKDQGQLKLSETSETRQSRKVVPRLRNRSIQFVCAMSKAMSITCRELEETDRDDKQQMRQRSQRCL
jgi:hypothetical protein